MGILKKIHKNDNHSYVEELYKSSFFLIGYSLKWAYTTWQNKIIFYEDFY